MFAIQGDPTAAQQALISVFAVAVVANPTAFASGSFKIGLLLDCNASGFIAQAITVGKTAKCTYPKDSSAQGTLYVPAINKTAPHPAAARLWEEPIFSQVNGKLASQVTSADLALRPSALFVKIMGGQNTFILGGAHPITEARMIAKKFTKAPPNAVPVPAEMPKSVLPTLDQQEVSTELSKTAWPKI